VRYVIVNLIDHGIKQEQESHHTSSIAKVAAPCVYRKLSVIIMKAAGMPIWHPTDPEISSITAPPKTIPIGTDIANLTDLVD
jgi:hypothetical protein